MTLNFSCKIIALGNLPTSVEDKFKSNFTHFKSYDLEHCTNNLDDVLQKHSDSEVVISFLCHKLDCQRLSFMPKLKVIANYAVGFDNIDIEAATKKNILVLNTPDVLSEATADLAFALTLAISRKINEGHKFICQNKWQSLTMNMFLGQAISRKTIGIIGLGRIGKIYAKRFLGFDVEILYTKKNKNVDLVFDEKHNARQVELDELLRQSDIVSIHCPLNNDTYHLIDANNLKKLKPNCILINTARGSVIEEPALIKVLQENRIFGAGLDVFENEPAVPTALKNLDNVVMSPHIGSADANTREAMGNLLYNGLLVIIEGKIPQNVVNKSDDHWSKCI